MVLLLILDSVDLTEFTSNFNNDIITTDVSTLFNLTSSIASNTLIPNTETNNISRPLFATYVLLCTLGVAGMFIACLITSVVFVRLLRSTRPSSLTCQNLYSEIEVVTSSGPVYEMVELVNPANQMSVETGFSESLLSTHEDRAIVSGNEELSSSQETGATDHERKQTEEHVTINTTVVPQCNTDRDTTNVIYQNTLESLQPVHDVDHRAQARHSKHYDDFVYPHFPNWY